MLEADTARRGSIAMKTVKAMACLVAISCLFSSAFGRPSIQTANLRPSLIRRRSLLAENTFDVTVTSNVQGGLSSSVTPLFTINFGRALVQKNPLGLFTIDGADRVDVVYSKEAGMLWVLSFVENKDQPGKVSIYVDSGVATAADGGATNNPTSLAVNYSPSPTAIDVGNAVNGTGSSSNFATAASWGVAGSLAVSLGAAALSPGGVVGVGAINFAGFAQTFAMSGNLPITNMPLNYKSVASSMEWVALQPKIGPVSPAPTDEEKDQAAALADTSARFPYTPVEVKILPDDSFVPSTDLGGGQTGEVVSIPIPSGNDTNSNDSNDSSASGDNSNTTGEGDSNIIIKPVLVVVVPLPEQDLVSSNGTKPSPFKPKPAANAAPAGNEGDSTTTTTNNSDGIITVPASENPQQQPTTVTFDAVDPTTTPSSPSGIPILGPTPPAPVAQQGGEDTGVIIDSPITPPKEPSTNDTVVVVLPEQTGTPPPQANTNTNGGNTSPPPAVPTNSSSGDGDGNSNSSNNNNSPSPTPAPGNNTTPSPGSPSSSPPADAGDNKESPPPADKDKTPPSPSLLPVTPGNGTAQQEGSENSGGIIDIPGAKLPPPPSSSPTSSPSPLPSPSSKSPAPAPAPEAKSPSPGPSPSSKSPSPSPSPSKSLSPSPGPSPAKSPSPAPAPSPIIERPATGDVADKELKDGEGMPDISPVPAPEVESEGDTSPSPAPEVSRDEDNSPSPSPAPAPAPKPTASPVPKTEDTWNDGPRVKPWKPRPYTGKGKGKHKGRQLLLNDPLAALSSSGFSYVVVTATADGSGGASVNSTDASEGETVGASALSRIRTIQNAGEGPDADKRRLNALWDVLFWTAIAVAATLFLHVCVLGLLRWAKKPVPKMLHLPRMELLVFMMTLPMIAAAGAGLLKSSNGGIVTLGVFFSVVLPFGFLGLASVFLVKYLLRSAVEQRRALYVLVATQDLARSELDGHRFSGGGGSSPEGSLTASMLGPEVRDSLAEIGAGGASGSGSGGASTSRAATAAAVSGSGGVTTSNGDGNITVTEQSSTSSFFKKTKSALYKWVLRPLFGFQDNSTHTEEALALAATDGASWLGRGKWDAEFVKRYGCFFEDTHGPQVFRVQSRYDPTSPGSASFNSTGNEDVVGSGVLVPATSTGAAEGALQALQTFGIVFAVTKMVLFAVIINGPGGVNSIGQVMALLLVALMHVVYLRLCHPYRLKIELAAEMVASTCDLAIFACGIALIAKPEWTSSERHNMGVAMLALQAVGFLIFITVRVALALRTLGKTVGPAVKDLWPKKLTFGSRASSSDAQFLASSSSAVAPSTRR